MHDVRLDGAQGLVPNHDEDLLLLLQVDEVPEPRLFRQPAGGEGGEREREREGREGERKGNREKEKEEERKGESERHIQRERGYIGDTDKIIDMVSIHTAWKANSAQSF